VRRFGNPKKRRKRERFAASGGEIRPVIPYISVRTIPEATLP
jgi:hypothetical protein